MYTAGALFLAGVAAAFMPVMSIAQQPPAPPTAPAPASVRTAPQSISFSADVLFAFDKSELRPEGKAVLDDFARQLGDTQYETISVTGHTDRLGASEYNQSLSQRRASTVKDYLVSRDVAVNRIVADGKGESQPVTRSGDCAGAQSGSVIACLQPDRRVRAAVTGIRTVQ